MTELHCILQVAFCDWVKRRTSINLMETTFEGWVRCKPLMKNDIRDMVVPYINDAIEPLEREITSRLRSNFSH